VVLKVDAASLLVTPTIEGRDGARFQGLARALLAGMVLGVAEGYTKTLQLVVRGIARSSRARRSNLALGFRTPSFSLCPRGSNARSRATRREHSSSSRVRTKK